MTESTEVPVQTPGKRSDEPAPVATGKKKDDWGIDIMIGLRLIVLLIVLIAAVQLYFTIQGVIGMWVADQYIPLVNAIYYIAVIVGGIWLLWGVLTRR
jgi:hypothetical protein